VIPAAESGALAAGAAVAGDPAVLGDPAVADGRGALAGVAGGRLRRRLETGQFAVTAELQPPRGPDPQGIERGARSLRGWVDAANLTDNQSSFVRLSSFAASLVAQAAGVEPVMQLTCRDRNRIGLQSDLLSAAAMGIPNVLLLTGDHPRFGDHADAKPVFDLDSVQLIWTARTMREQRRLLSGRELDAAPRWFIGAVENPFSPPIGFRAARLGKKVAAGAQFVQTQFVFDVAAFARWMAEVRDLGLDRRCHVLAGVGPIRSLRSLEHMRHHLPGLHIPDAVERRLRGVPADRVGEEGLRLCAEITRQVREIPGVAGVHLMAVGRHEIVPELLDRAGVTPRDLAGTAAAGEGGSRAG
jgi:methylenetetrahydrofolate reductase (NADPH)